MLTPILATDDPCQAASRFVAAGWSPPPFLAPDARPYQGAGVEFHVGVPAAEIDAIFAAHRDLIAAEKG
jgi:hypothetical protein